MARMPDFARVTLRLLTCRRVAVAEFPNSPALLGLLWLSLAIANVVDLLMLPQDGRNLWPSSVLHISGGVVLAAMFAAWAIGKRTDAVRIGIAFLLLAVAMNIVWLVVRALVALDAPGLRSFAELLWLWEIVAVASLLRKAWGGARSWGQTILATSLFGLIVIGGGQAALLDEYLYSLSHGSAETEKASEDYAPIDHETLWPAQPALVDKAVAELSGSGGAGRTFILTVAAGGSQQLFGREANAARIVLVDRFAPGTHGVSLSNARTDLGNIPLATRSNLWAVLAGAGRGFDPARDLMIVYLASHGGRDAELSTDLPDYASLKPISAQGLADGLAAAGITRRIVVVSACFAGTWIKPLASHDTIVVTAAAADRTSFGCDDSREFTTFGDAFINGSLRQGASLDRAFEDLKRRVADEEREQGATPSLPQAYVGDHMRGLWAADGKASARR
jgi:hypothetical protein